MATEAGEVLIGGGADITGRSVEYWGGVWTITGRNYLGDWTVETFEDRPSGRVRIRASISATELPEAHPHFARLMQHS